MQTLRAEGGGGGMALVCHPHALPDADHGLVAPSVCVCVTAWVQGAAELGSSGAVY